MTNTDTIDCPCGALPASACPGSWEPGCDYFKVQESGGLITPAPMTRVQRAARVTPHISTDEWWTPLEFVRPLGKFDLDPCAPVADPMRIGASRALTVIDDGLASEWAGRVWMNPPYSTAGKWVEKLSNHGDGIALVFARVETGWWHEHVWPKAAALLFLRGRISFVRGDGRAHGGHNAAAPSVLIAYGPENAEALRLSGLAGAFVDLARVAKAA